MGLPVPAHLGSPVGLKQLAMVPLVGNPSPRIDGKLETLLDCDELALVEPPVKEPPVLAPAYKVCIGKSKLMASKHAAKLFSIILCFIFFMIIFLFYVLDAVNLQK